MDVGYNMEKLENVRNEYKNTKPIWRTLKKLKNDSNVFEQQRMRRDLTINELVIHRIMGNLDDGLKKYKKIEGESKYIFASSNAYTSDLILVRKQRDQ